MFKIPRTTARLASLTIVTGLLAACASHGPGGPGGRGGPPPGGPDGMRPQDGSAGGDIARPIALLFVGMDTDQDNATSQAELETGIARQWADIQKNTTGDVTAIGYEGWSLSVFGAKSTLPSRISFDTNLDGVITQAEFAARLQLEFDGKDKDQDGLLTRAELITTLQSRGFDRMPGGGGSRPPGGGRGEGGQRPPPR